MGVLQILPILVNLRESRQNVQQRALACPRWAHDGRQLSGTELTADIFQYIATCGNREIKGEHR